MINYKKLRFTEFQRKLPFLMWFWPCIVVNMWK